MPAELIWTTRVLAFSAAHPTAAGHFPGNPVLPGAVLLAEIQRLIAPKAERGTLTSAKFLKAVRPGDGLEVRWAERAAGRILFEGRLADGALAISGSLTIDGDAP